RRSTPRERRARASRGGRLRRGDNRSRSPEPDGGALRATCRRRELAPASVRMTRWTARPMRPPTRPGGRLGPLERATMPDSDGGARGGSPPRGDFVRAAIDELERPWRLPRSATPDDRLRARANRARGLPAPFRTPFD